MASRCCACTYRRRKCKSGCLFAPYLSYLGGMRDYDAVYRCFGPRSFLKLLQKLPLEHRQPVAFSFVYEATYKINNLVLGCVAYFLSLERQILEIREQIEKLLRNLQEKTLDQNPGPLFQLGDDDRQIVTNFVDLITNNQESLSPLSSDLSKSSAHPSPLEFLALPMFPMCLRDA